MFKNREQAAQLLIKKLSKYKGTNVFVFAIPRGAVGMGKIIAKALGVSFDIVVVKKIGAPNNPELAIGAVGPEKTVLWEKSLRKALAITQAQATSLRNEKEKEQQEREKLLRGGKLYPNLIGKTVLIVDDGVATGATSVVAAVFAKKKGAKKIILVTPVIARDTLVKARRYFDEVVYLEAPKEFHAVGQFYTEFPQVTDDQVRAILEKVTII